MCEAEGGSLIDFTGYMVHVWTVPGYESTEGTFSDLNPNSPAPTAPTTRSPPPRSAAADTTCKNL